MHFIDQIKQLKYLIFQLLETTDLSQKGQYWKPWIYYRRDRIGNHGSITGGIGQETMDISIDHRRVRIGNHEKKQKGQNKKRSYVRLIGIQALRSYLQMHLDFQTMYNVIYIGMLRFTNIGSDTIFASWSFMELSQEEQNKKTWF